MFEVAHQIKDAHQTEIWSLSWAKNRIISGSSDGAVKVWDYDLGEAPLKEWKASPLAIISVVTSGLLGTSLAMDGHLKTWDFATGDLKYDVDIGCVNAWGLALHPSNSGLVATGGHSGKISVHEISTGKAVNTYETNQQAFILCVAFSSNGKYVAGGNKDGKAHIFETESQTLIRTIDAHFATIRCIAFSNDGQTVYTGSDDMLVRAFDVTSGERTNTLSGHGAAVLGLSVSPEGNFLATASADSKVKIWSGADCVKTLQNSGQVWSVCWNGVGTGVVAGGDDKSLTIYKEAQ